MAWRLECLEAHTAKREDVPILKGPEGVLSLCAGAQADGGADTVAQFQVPGQKIGMEVGEEHVPNLHIVLFGITQILRDVPLRVDDNGSTSGFVSNKIRGMRQTTKIILLQDHHPLLLCTQARQHGGYDVL
jgi:hypothetical protein